MIQDVPPPQKNHQLATAFLLPLLGDRHFSQEPVVVSRLYVARFCYTPTLASGAGKGWFRCLANRMTR